ncbi:MAG TPA: hypothetical protein VFY59_14085, partial [Rubrobacter sp.]|nr:hypothetical protein [Rubrobacter sp.]
MSASAPTQATPRRLLLLAARVAWVAIAAITLLGAFASSVPARYAELAHPSENVGEAIAELGLSATAYALYNVALDTIFVSVFAMIAIIIFWRRSGDPIALLVATMLVVWGPLNGLFVLAPGSTDGMYGPLQAILGSVLTYLGYITWMLFFYLFPSGRFVPGWTRWLALLYGVFFFGLWTFTPYGPESWPPPLFGAAVLMVWGSFLVAQVYRYARVSSPVERQQTKWVVFGTSVALVGVLATIFTLGAAVDLRPDQVAERMLSMFLMDAFMLALPISIGIAVLRSRLFEIDTIINRTLVYGSLTLMLAAVYFAGVVGTQYVFRAVTGQERLPQLIVVVSTLAIAALFSPLRRRVQSFIDRRFYRRKYDAVRTLGAFTGRLRDETELGTLS